MIWYYLGLMLVVGGYCGVGVYLKVFAVAAGLTGLLANLGFVLADQLSLFLGLSFVGITSVRWRRFPSPYFMKRKKVGGNE